MALSWRPTISISQWKMHRWGGNGNLKMNRTAGNASIPNRTCLPTPRLPQVECLSTCSGTVSSSHLRADHGGEIYVALRSLTLHHDTVCARIECLHPATMLLGDRKAICDITLPPASPAHLCTDTANLHRFISDRLAMSHWASVGKIAIYIYIYIFFYYEHVLQ